MSLICILTTNSKIIRCLSSYQIISVVVIVTYKGSFVVFVVKVHTVMYTSFLKLCTCDFLTQSYQLCNCDIRIMFTNRRSKIDVYLELLIFTMRHNQCKLSYKQPKRLMTDWFVLNIVVSPWNEPVKYINYKLHMRLNS